MKRGSFFKSLLGMAIAPSLLGDVKAEKPAPTTYLDKSKFRFPGVTQYWYVKRVDVQRLVVFDSKAPFAKHDIIISHEDKKQYYVNHAQQTDSGLVLEVTIIASGILANPSIEVGNSFSKMSSAIGEFNK